MCIGFGGLGALMQKSCQKVKHPKGQISKRSNIQKVKDDRCRCCLISIESKVRRRKHGLRGDVLENRNRETLHRYTETCIRTKTVSWELARLSRLRTVSLISIGGSQKIQTVGKRCTNTDLGFVIFDMGRNTSGVSFRRKIWGKQ